MRNDQSVREGVDYNRNHSPVSETKECGLFCCFRKTSIAGTQQFLANEVSDIVENRLKILVGLAGTEGRASRTTRPPVRDLQHSDRPRHDFRRQGEILDYLLLFLWWYVVTSLSLGIWGMKRGKEDREPRRLKVFKRLCVLAYVDDLPLVNP